MTVSTVWFVVPEGYDDTERVSGGNVYDQRIAAELRRLDWDVRIVRAGEGADPLDGVPADGLVLVDGLVAISAPAAIESAAERRRIVTLVHMAASAFDDIDTAMVEGERRAIPRAHRVIVTSEWLKDELARQGLSTPEQTVVAPPGADDASPAVGTPSGRSLLCVGVVAPHKGQDTLVDALAELGPDPAWTCTFVGSLTTDPGFSARVAEQAARAGIAERIAWTGVMAPRDLDDAFSRADLLVAPSRTESYGIAVGDALRRGIPVIASRVGGLPEAAQPRDAVILVPPHDPKALGYALRQWVDDSGLRARMSAAARRTGPGRRRWSDTARTVQSTLAGMT